jgi:anthranilate synthase component I
MNSIGHLKKGGGNRLIPLIKHVPLLKGADEIFSTLSSAGAKPHALFFESADLIAYYGKMSVIILDPCLRIGSRGRHVRLEAFDETGERFLEALRPELSALLTVEGRSAALLEGMLPERGTHIDEMSRLREVTPFHVLRVVLSKMAPAYWPPHLFCGLFGAISYDFVETFESLPPAKADPLNEEDMVFYYGNTLLLADHEQSRLTIVANALVFDEKEAAQAFLRATDKIEEIEGILAGPAIVEVQGPEGALEFSEEFDRATYVEVVERLKKHIVAGDIFQAVPSRTLAVRNIPSPWSIYKALRAINPSPYMFYIHDGRGVLLGASPEMLLRITGCERRLVITRPIAGTRPRGLVGSTLDAELDSRFEASLKTDFKELAEHSMLIDLGRNDIARVSAPGTRMVIDPYCTEKYSHVQHLVSTVQGELKKELDAFHAYLSVMNAGTLTGAPKLKAMELLRGCEKSKRGYYGGAAGYFSINGEMDSCIIIRSMRIIDGTAYLRAGAGIVHDSIGEAEFDETERKLAATRKAIEEAKDDTRTVH